MVILSISKENSGFVFDIESNPDEKHDFLYGFIEINNLFEEIEDYYYEPILNINKTNREIYEKIMSILFSKEDLPVLHYGETEKIAIILLAKKLDYDFEKIEILKSRFIDLHEVIRKSWILPIKNYSLKTAAIGLDFNGHKKCKWIKSALLVDSISNYKKRCISRKNY